MQKNSKAVYYAKNLSDIFYNLKTVPHLKILAGCTQCERTTDGQCYNLPDSSLVVRAIPELKKISRREHFITFASAVTLNSILELGKKHVPSVLYEAVQHTATSSIRNLATIGGNICAANYKTSLYAALAALDAELEYKSPRETKTKPFAYFTGIPEGYVLTEVKIPLEDWTVSIYKRLGPQTILSEESGSFCFLADTSRGILGDFHIVYCGDIFLRSRELENKLIGSRLPLNRHSIDNLINDYATIFSSAFVKTEKYKEEEDADNEFSFQKWQFTNLLKYSFEHLI
jgi:CO/xanthine dehydrogenase FAD-binding subunit